MNLISQRLIIIIFAYYVIIDADEIEPIDASADVSTASSYNWDSHSKTSTSATASQQEDFFSSISAKEKVRFINVYRMICL